MNEPAAEQSLDVDLEVVAFERSPLDVIRLLVFAISAVAVVLGTRYLRQGMDGLEENISSALSFKAPLVRITLDSLLIAATIVTSIATMVVPLVTRRWRLFGYVITANIAAGVAIAAINSWVGDLDSLKEATVGTNGLAIDASTDVAAATPVVAAFIALAPFVSVRWRKAGMWAVAATLILRVVVADGASTHLLMVLTVGGAIGSAVLLAYGRPATQPRPSAIASALRSNGLPMKTIDRATVDARGSVPWFATLETGDRLFVKVLGTDQRAADLLFRTYRMFRLRNVGDERPFSSLRRTVEHEALVAFNARDVGVRTPRLRAMSAVGGDGFLLAYDMIDGASLDSVEPDELTDEVLEAIWAQVAILRTHRIAHRDLRLANLFLARSADNSRGAHDDAPAPWIIDFGFSEIAAQDQLLNTDVAQLLTSLALVVGPQRAVRPAVDALGTERTAACLARLQPAALSGSTQSALKDNDKLLDDLRDEIGTACAVKGVRLEPVTRFSIRQLTILALLVAVVYVLVPQLANITGILDRFSDAQWSWLVPLLVATAMGFIGAAWAAMGSTSSKIPTAATVAAQLGASYAAKTAPAGLGTMELNIRFLQKQGIEPGASTAAVGLRAASGIVAHTLMTVLLVVWVLRTDNEMLVPRPGALWVGLAVVLVLGALALALPKTRRRLRHDFLPTLESSKGAFGQVMSMPGKLALLLGGSLVVTISYAVGFYFTAQMFDIGQTFAVTLAVYLVCSAIASVAPTPGGVGAVEVALITGMVAVGVDTTLAVPTVFMFRIVTFWLPVLPGWLAFRWLQRTDRL
ncbi:MAG: lysylphosphatidylglycerol synthase domain-containing protein [Microthrixaceae bacterium]